MSIMKKLTFIFLLLAAVALIFCVFVYGGSFNVGHGNLPLIVLFTSAPAALVFIAILIVSIIKLKDTSHMSVVRMYYFSITLNIVINLVASYPLLNYV